MLLGLVVFLFGFSNKKNSAKKVSNIQIEFEEGNNLFMDYQMVNKLLIQNNESPKNKAKSIINLHKLEANLLSHPMVEHAAVYLTVDGSLKTKIKQRTPIARILSNSESYYIDRQAKIMPLSKNHAARVLLVSGNVSKNDCSEIHLLVTTILNDNFLKKQLVEIEKTPQNEYVFKTRVGEHKIILGKMDDLHQKFKNLKSFYSKAMVDKTIDNYSTLNLKYSNQVVCTKK